MSRNVAASLTLVNPGLAEVNVTETHRMKTLRADVYASHRAASHLLPSTSLFRKGAPVFAALGDETRLRILAKLSQGGPLSITQLTDGEDVTRQAITKHLDVLAAAGLVRDARSGRERRYELDLAPLEAARSRLDLVAERWDQRLKRFVEG